MPHYPKRLMLTPGKRRIPVSVINPKYQIRQFNRIFQIPLLDKSGIRFTAECIKEHNMHKRDCPILVTGDPGVGKTTVICQTAQTIDPKFDVSQIAFRLEEFEQIFDKNPYGDAEHGKFPQADLDEAGHALYGPEWLAREQRVLAKQLIITRIKRQIVWAAVPKRMQFNNQLRNMMKVWIHVSEPEEFVQGYAVVRFAPARLQSEWYSDKYWVPKYAFIFGPLVGDFWERYEAKKIAFVNEVTADTANGKTARRDEFEVRVVDKLRQRGMKQEEIADIIGRNQSTVSRLITTNTSIT